jgi:hypothetical protein
MQMRFLLLFIGVFVVCAQIWGQENFLALLPPELDESSGLVVVGDRFISMNDSGAEPILIVFSKKGKLLHKVRVLNAKNVDWEALTLDNNGNLYIGDIGDNKNTRKSLQVYVVSVEKVLAGSDVTASKIEYTYPDKTNFPPEKDQLYFDAEGMVWRNDSLFVFTKNRTQPFDGLVKVYAFPVKTGTHQAAEIGQIQLPATSWLENSVTDAAVHKNTLYLLTYRYIYIYKWKGNDFTLKEVIEFNAATQKEGLFYKNGKVYVTDEKSILGKQRLYEVMMNQ